MVTEYGSVTLVTPWPNTAEAPPLLGQVIARTAPAGAAVVDGVALVVAAALDDAAAEVLLAAAAGDGVELPPVCPRMIVAMPAARIAPTPIQTISFCRRFFRRRASLKG